MLRGGCPSRCARLAALLCLLCNHIYHSLALVDEPAFPEAAGYICLGAALCSRDIHMCLNAPVVSNSLILISISQLCQHS